MADTIGIARQQTIFCLKETTRGTLVHPAAAGTTPYMIAAGYGEINQPPSFTNSEEIKNSRDVIDRFVDKRPAGTWSFPIYVRPSGTPGSAPMGDVLFECLQGTKAASAVSSGTDVFTGAGLNDLTPGGAYAPSTPVNTSYVVAIDAEGTPDTFKWSNDGGATWEAETVAITGAAQTLDQGVTIAFAATTGHTSGNSWAFTATYGKVLYTQALTKPSFSLWMKKGHTLFFASGCTVTDMKLDGATKGSPVLTFSGGLMNMGWCGEDTLKAISAQNDTTIEVDHVKRFSVGAKIYNSTKSDTGTAAAGYTITAINYSTGILTVSPGVVPAGGWEVADIIKPYLPAGATVGSPVLARDVSVDIGSTTGKALQSYSISVNDPVMYPEEISADDHPTDYMEDTRNITFDFKMYLRQMDIESFYDGFSDTEVAVDVNIGDTVGSMCEISMPQVSINVPTVETSAPALSLNVGGLALGSTGEDSLVIEFM